MKRTTIFTFALVALLAAPTSVAAWLSYGEREPSTTYDVAAGRNFEAPDTSVWTQGGSSTLKVYFNMFSAVYVTSANPNAGAAGTRILPQPVGHYEALLGVWKDCNHDGYIGQAESGVREYRSELLTDTSTCPPTTGTGALTFNDGQWVNEFVAIGAEDPCTFENATVRATDCGGIGAFRASPTSLNINGTKVWYDFGVPGEGGGTGTCPINPQPRGTYERTGGLLSYVECFRGYQDLQTFNSAVNGAGNPGGIAFTNPGNPMCDHSALNPTIPVNLWGDPCTGKSGLIQYGSNDPAVTVFDCEKGTTYSPVHSNGWDNGIHVDTTDPTKSSVDPSQVDPTKITADPTDNRTVNPVVHAPLGSYADTAGNVADAIESDCDPSNGGNDAATVFGTANREGGVASRVSGRAANSDHMSWIGSSRGAKFSQVTFGSDLSFGTPADSVGDQITDTWNNTVAATLGERFSGDAGTGFCRFICGVAGTNTGEIWAGAFNIVQTQLFSPTALAKDGVSYVTAYARVGGEIVSYGLTLRVTDPAVYGGQNCSDTNPGAAPENGWICDPTLWYKDATGKDIEAYSRAGKDKGVPLEARVGEPYDLIDVDCHDGHLANVAGVEVQASLTNVNTNPTGPSDAAICKAV